MDDLRTKVFISYAHTDDEHVASVGELIRSLISAGFRVASDRDVMTPQGPSEGWPAWMLNQLDQAEWVLIVCDETYYRRFRGIEEPGRGLGARWEGSIITQTLYSEGVNRKFVPLLFGDEPTTSIPEPLRNATRHRIPDDLPYLLQVLGSASTTPAARSISARRSPKVRRYALPSLFIAVLLPILLLVFNLRPSPNFPLTVSVHGTAGRGDVPLRNQGAVLLDLGGDRRRQPIDVEGQARFLEIPASFRGQSVNIVLDAAGYEAIQNAPVHLDTTNIDLTVRPRPARITGSVLDESGEPVVGATIRVADMSATSKDGGRFEIVLPSERVDKELPMQVEAAGYETWHQMLTRNGGPATAVLVRKR